MTLASPATTLSGAGIAAASRRMVVLVVDPRHEDAVGARLDVAESPA